VADVDFLVGEATSAMDNVADRLATGGAVVKQNLADFLTQVAVVIREVRGLGIPYLT
jgi:hypothetical protein